MPARILGTDFETDEGRVTLIDFMPRRGSVSDLVRIVVGWRGRVRNAQRCRTPAERRRTQTREVATA